MFGVLDMILFMFVPLYYTDFRVIKMISFGALEGYNLSFCGLFLSGYVRFGSVQTPPEPVTRYDMYIHIGQMNCQISAKLGEQAGESYEKSE